MKLPFNSVLSPILRPYFTDSRLFCRNTAFLISIPYTYVYSILGLLINAHHLKKHLGETPGKTDGSILKMDNNRSDMLVHDLKIIATSMGLVQYACLIVGCITENPSLFLPHLTGQLIVVSFKILNLFLYLANINMKTLSKLGHKVTAILLMTFNWLQEFCVFRQHLCVCDL